MSCVAKNFVQAARYAVLAMKATVSNLSTLSQEEVSFNSNYVYIKMYPPTYTQLSKLQSIASGLKPVARTDSTHELTKVNASFKSRLFSKHSIDVVTIM